MKLSNHQAAVLGFMRDQDAVLIVPAGMTTGTPVWNGPGGSGPRVRINTADSLIDRGLIGGYKGSPTLWRGVCNKITPAGHAALEADE